MVENYSTVPGFDSTVTDCNRNDVLVLKRIYQNKPNEIIFSFTLSINNIILRKKRGPKK